MKITSDFLVVGSGIAGLCYALTVADRGQVALITKREIATTATRLAQGGIAAVSNTDDSFDQHIQDTMEAGAWLPDQEIVRMVVENGPEAIDALMKVDHAEIYLGDQMDEFIANELLDDTREAVRYA